MRVLLAEEAPWPALEEALEDCLLHRVADFSAVEACLGQRAFDCVLLNLGIPPLRELGVPVFWLGERLAPETGELPLAVVQPGLLVPILELALRPAGTPRPPTRRGQAPSREPWADMLLRAPLPLLSLDTAGQVRFANDSSRKLLEAGGEDLAGRPFSDFVEKADRDTFSQQLWAWLQSDDEESGCAVRLHTKKGVRQFRICGRGPGFEQPGTTQLALIDISHYVQQQETSQLWRSVLDAALESVDFGVLVCDQVGSISFANPAACSILGYSFEQLRKLRVAQFFPRLRPDTADLQVLPGRAAERAFPAEVRVGATKVGRELQLIVQITDISRSRRAQNEIHEARERERWRVGQDLHDDVGQQLAALAFVAGVLQSRLVGADPELRTLAERVNQQCRQAIGRVRALARSLYPTDLERRGLPAALQELASNTADSFGVECRCKSARIPLSKPLSLHLYRIAQEAVSNAVRHAQPQQVDIELSTEGELVVLQISDDGCGMPDHIESPGIGLRSMRHHAELIQGNLQIESARGKTVVRCEAPRLPAAAAILPAPTARPARLPRRGPAR